MSRVYLVGGRVIDPATRLDAVRTVVIEFGADGLGRFAEVREAVPSAAEAASGTVVDCSGKLVLPGLVDLHVHLREPGEEGKETVESGCRAAVAGGVTTVVAMPNTRPVCDSAAIVRLVQSRAREAGLCKVLIAGAITKGSLGEALADAAELADAGCVALTDDGRPVMNAGVMRRALEYARDLNLPVFVHDEDLNLSAGFAMNEGPVATRLGLPGYPNAAEVVMVERDLLLAEMTGARLHICHVSAAGSVRAIRAAKERGVKVTAEAAPHHFTLTDEAVAGLPATGYPNAPMGLAYDTHAKMNPPLRAESDRQAVVGALADGTIDAVATDHAPHGPLDTQVEFGCAANGVVGLETALPLLLSLVRTGELSLLSAIERMTTGPARVLGLPVGRIAVGGAADVIVVDAEKSWTVEARGLHSKSKNSPFLGWTLKGQVERTYVDGKLVFTAHQAAHQAAHSPVAAAPKEKHR
jgi:dihydroorotase